MTSDTLSLSLAFPFLNYCRCGLLQNSPKTSKISPSKSSRLPSNIPLRTLPTRSRNDQDNESQSTSLLDDAYHHQPHHGDHPHHRRPSSESDTGSSWTDTGDIGEQLGDGNDPVRLQLSDDIEDELLAGVRRGKQKHKKVRIQDPASDHSRSRSRTRIIDKESIEVPYVRPRAPTRAALCLGAIMGSSGEANGLTGKALL